jgi:membrane associated rhomboid family serine protease
VLGLVAAAGSALANLLPPSMRVVQLLSKGSGGAALLQPWRFLTASFVHQDVTSLVVGLLTFVAVAPMVEALLGKGWLVAVVIGGGFAATLASYAFAPGDYMGLIGADAALAGLLIFFALLQRYRLPSATVQQLAVRCLTALLIVAFASALMETADVAAAFGGFGLGMLLSPLARPGQKVREALEKVRAEPAGTAPASLRGG